MRLLIFIFCLTQFFAQEQVRFQKMGSDDGLDQHILYTSFQDKKGFLYLGGEYAFTVYDGLEFKSYKYNPKDSTGLSYFYINALAEDRANTIWIATGNGLSQFDPIKKTFKRYYYKELKKNNNELFFHSIICDTANILWASTNNRILKIDPTNGLLLNTYEIDDISASNFFFNGLKSFFIDSKKQFWFGGKNNIYIYSKKNDHFDKINLETDLPKNISFIVTGFVEDKLGFIWISTSNGLFKYHKEQGLKIYLKKESSTSISSNNLAGISIDNSNDLWIATKDKGLIQYISNQDKFKFYQFDPFNSYSLSSNSLDGVFVDKFSTLWITSRQSGLTKYNLSAAAFHIYSVGQNQKTSLMSNIIRSFYEDRTGILWVGTDDAGLTRLDRINNKAEHFYKINSSNSISDNRVNAIMQIEGQKFWIASMNGLNLFDYSKKTWSVFLPSQSIPNVSDAIFCFLKDDPDLLWIGSSKKLLQFNTKTKKFTTFPTYFHSSKSLDSISFNADIRAIVKTNPKELAIGVWNDGLYLFDTEKRLFTEHFLTNSSSNSLPNNNVISIYATGSNYLYIGTFGGGFSILDQKRLIFNNFSEEDGLADNLVNAITGSSENTLWISTGSGLNKFNIAQKRFVTYTNKDGLQSNEFNGSAVYKSPSGELFFGGMNGFNAFYPDDIKEDTIEAAPIIKNFKIIGESETREFDINEEKSIVINPGENYLSFEFAALHFIDPTKNKYAYYLENLEDTWQFIASKQIINYSNLNAGTYYLHLKVANKDGFWNKTAKKWQIIVIAPWYQRPWAYILYLILTVLFALFIRWLVKNWVYIISPRTRFISHYKLLELVGKGAMGQVYKALDTNSKNIVALKIIDNQDILSEQSLATFLKEVEIGKRLHHKHIINILQSGSDKHSRYLAMDYINGKTLKTLIKSNIVLTEKEQILIAIQILDGLKYIHDHAIVHRDLKTSNIMINEKNEIVIMDFGLASSSMIVSIADRMQVVGTLSYMSPEQTIGKNVTEASDLYSFGVILFELIYQKLPFSAANDMELIYSIHNLEPIYTLVNHPLHSIIKKCLEKDIKNRYKKVEFILPELNKLLL